MSGSFALWIIACFLSGLLQILTLPVEPGQKITTEPGTMAYAVSFLYKYCLHQ